MDTLEETAPQRRLLTTRGEYLACFDELLALAQRELRIFDPDLAELGFNTPGKIDRLRQFASTSATHRLWIAVHEPAHVMRHCPRFMSLLGSYSRSIFVYQTEGDALKAQDCFALADENHLVRRPVAKQTRGVLILNDPKDCQSIRDRFDEIWQSSVPSVSPATTGL